MTSDRKARPLNRLDRRFFWRDKSHQDSHSQAEDLLPLAAHPLAGTEPPVIVETAAALGEMLVHLKAAGAFAFDSEFIGERSYEPRLCLVQAATARQVFLADPLKGLDLSGLWELLVDAGVEKIVLAGQQDFGPAVQKTGRPPANIMDLQIAAGFVYADYPLSLSRLLAEFVGVPVGKALTFTHWDNRPLSARQVRYAADDVRYLPAAREAVGKRLAEAGRAAWAREECAAAMEDLALYRPAPETLYLRVRGRDRLRRRQLAILQELAVVRDQAARQENVPPRTLLKDGIMLSLARRPARELADLAAVKNLPRPVEFKYGRQIVEATAKALALPADRWPPEEPVEMDSLREQVDGIWAGIAQACQERSIALSLVASRKEVVRLCLACHGEAQRSRAAENGSSLEEHRLCRGWRKELLGDLLKKLIL